MENPFYSWKEMDLIPFETSTIGGDRILVMAPHPDDETLGCAGSLMRHVERGDKVKILFLTDGRGGDFEGLYDTSDYIQLREKEAANACQILGIEEFRFLRFSDRKLGHDSSHVDIIKNEITIFNPNSIYVTSPLEINPDHRAAASLVWQATHDLELTGQIVFYEISTPMQPNLLVDITEFKERKMLAASCYSSQMKQINYLDIALSMNKLRTLTVSGSSEFAEGYFVVDRIKALGKKLSDFFTMRKLDKNEPATLKPLVSIIVRTKDRPELLKDALASLANQSYKNLEVILVNDGGQTISDILAGFKNSLFIRSIEHEVTKGRSAAANSGLRQANGSFIGFLDDDDLLFPEHIESLVDFIQKNDQIDFVYSDCLISRFKISPHDNQLTKIEERPFKGIDYNQERLFQMNFIPIMTALFRKELLDKSGLMDESLEVFEDWDLWIRMSMHSNFSRLPKITADYRIIGNRSYDYLSGQIKIYEKYWQIYTPKKVIEWLHKAQGENDLLRVEIEKLRDQNGNTKPSSG